MKHLLPLILIGSLLLCACQTGQKAYQQGNYEEAVLDAVKRLRNNPDSRKAAEAIQAAYPALVKYYQTQVNQAKTSSNPLRWEKVMDRYARLNRIFDEIQRSPVALDLLGQPQSFERDYELAKRKSVEARYALGKSELEKGYRENAKLAYEHFDRLLALQPSYRDAEDLKYQALEMATLFIAVEPIPLQSQRYKFSAEFFQNQILEHFNTRSRNDFVRFIPTGDETLRTRKPDHVIKMIFDDFIVGQAYIKETVLDRTRDSVKIKATVGDSTVDAYTKVNAKMHIFQKEISSSGRLDLQILDAAGKTTLTQRKFPGTFVYYDEWGFFQGDKRALTDNDLDIITRNNPLPDPLPQTLFLEFTKPIYDQVTGFIRQYYRNY